MPVVRRRSWGSTRPSQVCSHIRVDAPRLLRAWQALPHTIVLRRRGISAGPGPRAVRASTSAPIDFRRGDRSPVGGNTICKSGRPGMCMASTSGLGLPSAIRCPGARLAGETILPWALPLAGLSGTFCRASAGLDPAADHQSPERRRTTRFAAGRFLSAHELGDVLPITTKQHSPDTRFLNGRASRAESP